MPRSKETSYPEIDEIRDDLDSLKNNVVELTRHLKSDGVQQAEQVSSLAQKRLKSLGTRGQQELRRIEKQVKQKPAQSMAIAFATGMLASMILRGRR